MNKMKKDKTEMMSVNLEGRTILIAEDEETNYMLLKVMLESTGARILHVINGKEAEKICQTDTQIDIVLMDIKMPEMNGLIATKLIKTVRPSLPVVALTAYALSGDKERCFEAGCDEYLPKPLLKNDLIEVLAQYLS